MGNPADSLLLLDACCLINLFATGRIEEILCLLPYRFATSRLVAETEVLSIARNENDPVSEGREMIPSSLLESLEYLTLWDLAGESEIAEFVRFAADLDDGEASVCALAVTRGGGVATDDRKVLRSLERENSPVTTVQTPELLYEWARLAKPEKPEVIAALQSIRRRARFYPRRDAPRYAWWSGLDP